MSVVCASSAARDRHMNMAVPHGGSHRGDDEEQTQKIGKNGDKFLSLSFCYLLPRQS